MRAALVGVFVGLFIVASGTPAATQQKRRLMGNISSPQQIPIQSLSAPPSTPPDADDGTNYYLWLDEATKRINAQAEDGSSLASPTLDTTYADVASNATVLINTAGRFDTTLSDQLPNPLVTYGGAGILGVRWPDTATRPSRVGSAMVVHELQAETARDGTTPVERSRLEMAQVDHVPVDGLGLSINMNLTSAQLFFQNDAPARFILTRLVVRDSDQDLSAFAGLVSVGTNSPTFDNWIAGAALTALVDGDSATILVPPGRIVILNPGDSFTWKNSTAFGSACHVRVDVWGYYVD